MRGGLTCNEAHLHRVLSPYCIDYLVDARRADVAAVLLALWSPEMRRSIPSPGSRRDRRMAGSQSLCRNGRD
jgi:hypothetical protein